jgi:hypothetical protein
VVVAVHGFFCADQPLAVQDSAFADRQIHFQTALQNSFKIANAKDFM